MKITYQWGKWHITCRSRWYLPVTAVKIAEEDNIYWRGRVLHWRGSIRKCPYFRPLSVPKSVNPSISMFNNNNKNNWVFLIFCPPPTFPLKKLFDAIKPNMLLLGNIVKKSQKCIQPYPQYIFITYQSLRTIQLCHPFNVFFAEIRKPAIIGDKVYHVIHISRCNFLFSFDG